MIKRLVFQTSRRYSAASTPMVFCTHGLCFSRLTNDIDPQPLTSTLARDSSRAKPHSADAPWLGLLATSRQPLASSGAMGEHLTLAGSADSGCAPRSPGWSVPALR